MNCIGTLGMGYVLPNEVSQTTLCQYIVRHTLFHLNVSIQKTFADFYILSSTEDEEKHLNNNTWLEV